MKDRHAQKGFTLLELIIVILVVGVLAALALPRMFAAIEMSRSTEAFEHLTLLRQNLQRCYLQNQAEHYWPCDIFDAMISDFETAPNAHFSYQVLIQSGPPRYRIGAQRNTFEGGDGGSAIYIEYDGFNTITRWGTGVFDGLHQQ